MSRVLLWEDELFPVVFISRAPGDGKGVDVPDDLLQRAEAARLEFEAVQEELHKYVAQ